MDPKLNTFAVRPPVDAIREFEIATSTYDAAFGRNPGAQLNVVLKSGSNNFHGALYEFHRNAAFDARNFFAPGNESAPKYIRNQFGFALGGPIRKDRTFFFADYEGTRAREGITRIANVPTLQERSGDFSQSLLGPARYVHRTIQGGDPEFHPRWAPSPSVHCRMKAQFANFVSSRRSVTTMHSCSVDHL